MSRYKRIEFRLIILWWIKWSVFFFKNCLGIIFDTIVWIYHMLLCTWLWWFDPLNTTSCSCGRCSGDLANRFRTLVRWILRRTRFLRSIYSALHSIGSRRTAARVNIWSFHTRDDFLFPLEHTHMHHYTTGIGRWIRNVFQNMNPGVKY